MTLRIGLVGGGNITDTHARAVLGVPGAEIAAIQGPNESRVRNLCGRYGGTPYTSYADFLEHRSLDAVAIGSPSGLHAVQGMAAARHGLHVLVEKPIDITTGRADALIGACEEAGVALGVFFQDRFKPEVGRLKDAVASGAIGRPLFADARVPWYRPADYYGRSRWRGTLALDGGGALINQAIHTADLLLWVLGDVERVQARTATLLHEIEAEDTGAAILEFRSGALGVFSFSTSAYPGYPRRVTISGTSGTIVFEEDAIIAADLRDQRAAESFATPASTPPAVAPSGLRRDEPGPEVPPAASSPVVGNATFHRAVVEDFVEAVRDGRAPRCDGVEARRSVELVEAIYQASRTEQGVLVSR